MHRVLVNTFRNIRRAPYQALAAVMVLTLTFFVAQIFIVLVYGSQIVLQYFETRPQVTAFFTDEVSESALLELKNQLMNQDYVAEVTYVSKDEALQIYREQNQDDPLLLEMVTAEILPASLEVSATSVGHLPIIKEDLMEVSGVEEVIFNQDVIDALTKWTNGLRYSGIALVAILVIMSLLVMVIIISMKVAAKRDEISTMKLLGATPWYINGPFVFEGAIYGFLGSLSAWLLVLILMLYTTPVLVEFLGDIPLNTLDPTFLGGLLGISILSAALLGMISGSFSSRRYGN